MKAPIDTDSSSVDESEDLERDDGETNAIGSLPGSENNDWNIHSTPAIIKKTPAQTPEEFKTIESNGDYNDLNMLKPMHDIAGDYKVNRSLNNLKLTDFNKFNDQGEGKETKDSEEYVNRNNPFKPNYVGIATTKTPGNKRRSKVDESFLSKTQDKNKEKDGGEKNKYNSITINSRNMNKMTATMKSQVSPRSAYTSKTQLNITENVDNRQKVVQTNRSIKVNQGQAMHKSILERRETKNWGKGGGTKGNLSYDKLIAAINLKHPRQIRDGVPRRIPLCISTGGLVCSKKELYAIDDLGIAVSIYFKLLKSLIWFFLFSSMMCIPLYFLYSCGNVSLQASSSLQEYLSEWTLGNIGESSYQCKQRNLKIYDSIELWCPSGSKISSLEKFGLQRVGASVKENQCPQTISSFQTLESLLVRLDDQCDLEGLSLNYNDYYEVITNQFNTLCLNKGQCDMFVRNMDWPEDCAEKIGVRLQVLTIPETKYRNITETIRIETIVHPEISLPDLEQNGADVIESSCLNLNNSNNSSNETSLSENTAENNCEQQQNGTNSTVPEYIYPQNCDESINITSNCIPQCSENITLNCLPLCNTLILGNCSSSNDLYLNPALVPPEPIIEVSYIETTTVTSYIEYKEAYEYVIDQSQEGFYLYVIFECSNEIVKMRYPYEDEQIERSDLGILSVVIDIAVMSVFLICLWFMRYFVRKEKERQKTLLFETKEFSVSLSNLPKVTQFYGMEQMKAELWDHLLAVMQKEPQRIQKLAQSEEGRACEIIDIQFAMSDYQFLNDIVGIKNISNHIEKIEMEIEELKDDDKIAEQQDLKQQYLQQIENMKQSYFKNLELMGTDNQAIQAFVLFRSMEGVERCISAFYQSWLKRKLLAVFKCCRSSSSKSKLFRGKQLVVERGLEPELLLWENFGVSQNSRRIRYLVYFVFVVFMLIVCFYIIFSLEKAGDKASNEVPDIQCPSEVDANAANIDYYADQTLRSGDFHCFCKNLFSSEGLQALQAYVFPLDQKSHCNEWFSHYTTILMTISGIAFLIIIGNVAVEVLIQYGAKFTRPINEQQIVVSSIRAISWIQFINLGLVLFVINMSLNTGKFSLPAGILQGDYQELSSMWYVNVGTQIILAMILEISAPHLIPCLQMVLYSCRRFHDRRWTCDKKKSRKLLQSEYEQLYIGPLFNLDARLAQIIAFTWVTFMYSAGLPILFLITAFNFMLIYWVDKWLVLRFYRTPKNYDEVCINFSIEEIKYSFIFHFIIGAVVYSNEKILTSKGIGSDLIASTYTSDDNPSLFSLQRYNSVHVILFFCANLIIFIIIIFEQTIISFLAKNLTCFQNFQNKFESMQAISDDYYDQIHFKFLISEYERAKLEKQRYTLFIDQIKNDFDFNSKMGALNSQIKRLKHKEKQILLKIEDLCQLIGVEELTIQEKVAQLQINILKLQSQKNYRIKSKVQTYDIRDCEQYYGILELEAMLKRMNKVGEQGSYMDISDIQRQSSKVYVPGSNYINKRKGRKAKMLGSPDRSKVFDIDKSKFENGDESDSLLSESELDDMLMRSYVDPSLMGFKLDQSNIVGSTPNIFSRDKANYSSINPKKNMNTIEMTKQQSKFQTIETNNPYDSKPVPFKGYQEAPQTVQLAKKLKSTNLLNGQSSELEFNPYIAEQKSKVAQRVQRPSYFYKK